ncbi:RdgB/HAM1 family non-canonical purine NTP pyrophosphatase [Thioalkalicoccus limnaeus]|uniref:dITP/XTP pyrophosphatase n=1 Tax=Thioalkalicoccus limnaeus TaxID=120681 RepID=A0ABV4BA38_9GAMM
MSRSPLLAPLVLASNNRGKIAEINQLLSNRGLSVRPQADFGVCETPETGLTFVENALLKARHATRISGRAAIADDSGLEVDALSGAPGIRSARYAGPGASDADNLAKLLEALADVPETARTARFRCLIVLLRHAEDPTPIICLGTWEGRISLAPRGQHGFGYDPVFFVPTHGVCAAELDPETKNRLSHRGQALRELLGYLEKER